MDQMWHSPAWALTKRHHVKSERSTRCALDIFNTLCVFAHEPIREQEIEYECTITTAHHLFGGHCVNSEVIVLDLGIFLRELCSLRKIPRSKTITDELLSLITTSFYILMHFRCNSMKKYFTKLIFYSLSPIPVTEFWLVQAWRSSCNVINVCVSGAVRILVWRSKRKCTRHLWRHVRACFFSPSSVPSFLLWEVVFFAPSPPPLWKCQGWYGLKLEFTACGTPSQT